MRLALLRLWRSLTNDFRCALCDHDMIPWRSGEWVCPVHDLV